MNYTLLQMVRDMWGYIRPYRTKFIFGSLIRASGDVVIIFAPLVLGSLITFLSGYHAGMDLGPVYGMLGYLAFAYLYDPIVNDVGKYLIYNIAKQISLDAQLLTLKHLFSLDSLWQEKENSGNKLKRISRGGDGLEQVLRLYMDLVIDSTISLISLLVIVLSFSWQLNLLLLFFFASFYVLSVFSHRKVKIQEMIVHEKEEDFDGLKFEAINNIATLKSLGITDNIFLWLQEKAREIAQAVRKRIFHYRSRDLLLRLYQYIFRLAILAVTIWQVVTGQLAVGIIATILLYVHKVGGCADEFSRVTEQLSISKVAIMRLQELLKEVPYIEQLGRASFPDDWQKLTIDRLSFSYGHKPVLDDLSLEIKRGQKIGIVGLSGAGKSTLFKLLLKLYDYETGDILFDEVSLRDIRRKDYVKHIAYVAQEIELFNMSLETNIAFEKDLNADQKEQVKKAADIAHVADFGHKLSQGFDTFIGEKGVKLSGGERQRVGIARAVYRSPEILFLDEATSHLDTLSEERIQTALHQVFQNMTAIVIAHRLSTVKEMDKIVVIQNGRLIEQGSFQELLDEQGEFWKMWQRQKF